MSWTILNSTLAGGAGTIGYVGFAMTGLPGDVVGTDYHFGWMRVGVSAYDNTSNSLVITAYDYAYESVAGVGITIPDEPISLWIGEGDGCQTFAVELTPDEYGVAASVELECELGWVSVWASTRFTGC